MLPRVVTTGSFSLGVVVSYLKAPLHRSRTNRMVAGVVAGLGHSFGVDVTLPEEE